MTTWHSSDLGWSAGDNVSQEFASLVSSSFKPGDTLVLDEMYEISGSYQLPDGFTLTAEAGGGFEVRTSSGDSSTLFKLGSDTTIDNVTMVAVDAPDTGYEGGHAARGVDYHPKKFFQIGGDDVTISNCAFSGDIEMFVDARGGDRLTIEDTSFEGSWFQVRLVGSVDDAVITGSHFKDALGDGIKTERSGEYGPQRTEILNSFFEGANRDGIDTAGGFKDGHIADCVFYDNGVSALDLKVILEKPEDLSPYNDNADILIERVDILDSRNGIVVTMLDRIGALTASNADQHMPRDIVVRDTVFEKTDDHPEEMRAFLIKDGYNITWDNVDLLGGVSELSLLNAEAPDGWTAYNIGGDASAGSARNIDPASLWDGN